MPFRTRFIRAATFLAACTLLTACAGTSAPPRSALQESIGAEGGVSARELRLRLYELPQRLGGSLESAAEKIRANSSDPGIRRRALLWEADGIPALYAAALRPDPLAGALDLWVLLYQMEGYFETGEGKDDFGPQQEIAVAAVKQMIALTNATAEELYPTAEGFRTRQAQVQDFARAHPVEGAFSARESALTDLAKFSHADGGALAALGEAQETLADISLRLNAYVTLLPKVARWQAALAAEDVTGRDSLRATLDDVQAIGAMARRADRLLADIPGAVREASGPLEELVDRQRSEMLDAVARERATLTGFITAERETALAAVSEERKAAMASVAEERAAVLAGLDALSKRSFEDMTTRARSLTNAVFWRGLALIAAAALLFGVAYRLARGPRPLRE